MKIDHGTEARLKCFETFACDGSKLQMEIKVEIC